MNVLRLFTSPTNDPRTFSVYWAVRMGEKNSISVTILDRRQGLDLALTAELMTVRYLLVEKGVFGQHFSGDGLHLMLSYKPAFEALTDSSINSFGYSHFFHIRHHGARVELQPDHDWFHEWNLKTEETREFGYPQQEIVVTPVMGAVVLTLNAIQRYRECINDDSLKNPWKSLSRRLRHPEIQRYQLPEKIRFSKLVKYSSKPGGVGEIWRHENSLFHYVTTERDEKCLRYLVTVFRRKEEFVAMMADEDVILDLDLKAGSSLVNHRSGKV